MIKKKLALPNLKRVLCISAKFPELLVVKTLHKVLDMFMHDNELKSKVVTIIKGGGSPD